MTTTQVCTLEELIQFTPTEQLELLAGLVADGTLWQFRGLYRILGAAALADGLITPEGRVTEAGYAVAARYEEELTAEADQRAFAGADESVPGAFGMPNIDIRERSVQ
jgi:hypothetical protein